MPVSTETSQVDYTGNGSQTAFPTGFKFLDETDLVVEVAPDGGEYVTKSLGVDYTVSGEGSESGGTVTFDTAPEADSSVRITRTVPLTQAVNLREQGPFSPTVLTKALDKLTMGLQQTRREVLAALAGITTGGAAFGFLSAESPLTPSNALQARFRSNGTRVEISEYGGRWRRVTDQDEVRDIRDYLSTTEKTNLENGSAVNATAAMQEIFAEISAVPGTAVAAKEAKIFHPGAADDLFQIEETCEYIGAAGRGLTWMGNHSRSRLGDKGCGYKWVGAEGGTMFDLRGINSSRISGLNFNGGGKAKYLVRGREYYDGVNPLIGSSYLYVDGCRFSNPTLLDGDSALFAAGADNSPNTYQCDSYSFVGCEWEGCNELGLQGWGFRALAGGNTKNFDFLCNAFSYLYRGIEASSGVLRVCVATGLNIGYARGNDAALVVGYGESNDFSALKMENSAAGYLARLMISGGTNTGTALSARSFYLAGTLPADDYAIVAAGPAEIEGGNFQTNARAGSNVCKIQATGAESAAGCGGVSVRGCTFGYNTTQLTEVPIYDGSNNLLTAGDYARNTGHKLEARRNVCGTVAGSKNVQLPDIVGDDVANLREQMKTDNNTAGLTIVRNANGNFVVTIPYTVFKTSGTGIVVIGELPLKSKLSECIPDTTVAFAGPAGTIQLRIGIDDGVYDDDALILAHDVKSAPVRKGQADADLGVKLALATSARGNGCYFSSWTGTASSIKVKMVLGAGALTDLTAGSVTIYIEHKRVG